MRLTRLKNTLIATVSHELKTPLSSVRMLVDTILEGRCTDRSQEREYLELVARENLRLSRLIDNFLTFSRMERNKHAFQFESVPPESIIRDAVESVRERFDHPGCELRHEVEGDLPVVQCDRDAMVTVLLNLIDNAYKYSRNEKRVLVRATRADGFVRFEVKDNGIGIPRRARKHIFERFYQVEQGLSREQGGVGLGLSIVRFILDAHGGRILLESEPGKGTTFSVDVPIAGEAANGSLRKDPRHAG
jgi:signal transduction histidine kinase